MTKTIVLVSCVSQKGAMPSPARQLYQSDWFIKASRYASRIGDEWYILSAKYGLLHPDQVIAPYNLTLKEMGKRDRQAWARKVMAALSPCMQPGDTIVFLAGEAYREYLTQPISRLGCATQIPVAGLRIGEQLSWLNQHLHGEVI